MDANLVIAAEAQDDLDEAHAWYEARRVGRGEDFLLRVEACLSALCRTPEIHKLAFERYRRALVREFPYSVMDELEGTTMVV